MRAERPYYFNVKTNESTWAMPGVPEFEKFGSSPPGNKSPALPEPADEPPTTPLLFDSQSTDVTDSQSVPSNPMIATNDATTQTGEKEFRFLLRETETSSRLVSVKEYKGYIYVGIREFFRQSSTGQLIPTKKGINLRLDEWSRLKCILGRVDEAVKTLTCC